MGVKEDVTLADMVRSVPVQSTLLTLVPIALALLQLANSYVNDLSLLASVPFAFAMGSYVVILTRYQLAHFRRHHLERSLR